MSGLGIVSEGKAASWFREGHTAVKLKSHLDVTYGVSTSVTVGITNRYSLGALTGITAGSKFDATLAAEYSFKKTKSLSVSRGGGFYAMNSYAGSVGASDKQLAHARRLEIATYILLGAQTAAMIATTALATTQAGIAEKKLADKKKTEQEAGEQEKNNPDGKEGSKEGEESESKDSKADDQLSITDQRINLALWLMSNITTTASALAPLFMVIANKWMKLGKANDPAAVLTMDATGGVFLGTRKTLAPNPTSGVFINETGVELSSARQGLEYHKPNNGTSILGFAPRANRMDVGGAYLKVSGDGITRIGGKGINAYLTTRNGPSAHTIHAEEHQLNVTRPQSAIAAGPALSLKAGQAQLKADDNSSVSVRPNIVSALAGGANGSAMRLEKSYSAIGTGGNNITIHARGVTLNFGNTTLSIDSTGFALGKDLTILNPGAPGISFAGLKDAVTEVTALRADLTASQAAATAAESKFSALENLVDAMNFTMVEVRDQLDDVTSAL